MQAPALTTTEADVRATRLRWAILAMLFAATVLNYVDRQTLSILASQVQKDLGIDNVGYAHIVQSFLIAYALSYLGAGDDLNARAVAAYMRTCASALDAEPAALILAGQVALCAC